MKSGTRGDRIRKSVRTNYQLYLVLLVPVVWVLVFRYYPMYGAQIAFRKFIAGQGIWGSPWVGLAHFETFFTSFQFKRVFFNTIGLSLYSLVASFPMAIILALLINDCRFRILSKFTQMVTYAPHFISTVVMVGMILQVLSLNIGLVNNVIVALGGEQVHFMGNPSVLQDHLCCLRHLAGDRLRRHRLSLSAVSHR